MLMPKYHIHEDENGLSFSLKVSPDNIDKSIKITELMRNLVKDIEKL